MRAVPSPDRTPHPPDAWSRFGCGIAVALAVVVAGCGDYNSPTEPARPPVSGTPGPVGATVTIGANGAVSPGSVTISVGQSVAFVNNNTRRHDMTSDPHPTHTDCPQMNAVGFLNPGQTRNTNAFPTARTCSFHDHDDPDNASLRGQIVITP
jgi:plastocyanin